MYIESANIGQDHQNTTFFDYLGVDFKDDGADYEVNTLKGTCAGCSDLLKYYFLGGISPHYKVDRLAGNGSTLLLSSEEGHGRMFVHENGNYRVISSSVVIGAIANSDSLNIKPFFLSEFINYFIGYNPVTRLQENIDMLVSGEAFPNPFSTGTTIVFNLTTEATVKITIYDLHGTIVKQLTNARYKPGNHKIEWDVRRDDGGKAAEGYYLCTIQTGAQVKTQKLILLQ